MKSEKQRIAIAEACGWVGVQQDAECKLVGINPNNDPERIPDYLNDLNAMHEAEKVIDDYMGYVSNLYSVVRQSNGWAVEISVITATATQRAEAFLKTLNLWEQ